MSMIIVRQKGNGLLSLLSVLYVTVNNIPPTVFCSSSSTDRLKDSCSSPECYVYFDLRSKSAVLSSSVLRLVFKVYSPLKVTGRTTRVPPIVR